MGQWGAGVLDGDSPLDVLDWTANRIGLTEELRVDLYPLDRMDPATRDALAAALAIHSPAGLYGELLDDSTDPAWQATAAQVLGAVAMAAGVPIDATFAAAVIAAAESDPEWAHTQDAERAEVMAELVTAVRDYDGTPRALSGTPLFEAIGVAFGHGS